MKKANKKEKKEAVKAFTGTILGLQVGWNTQPHTKDNGKEGFHSNPFHDQTSKA